ncbi:MAG: caspase family protein [Hyphomicrobiales bacterium]|nr:caspase family protein [Hyphomicrobiales bacterium]MBV8824869.1 caspase family protein [Hyphomicrobiales bacterium]MBV9428569.1 caspase family protein [Bradyrhizobiaceae bacterium]
MAKRALIVGINHYDKYNSLSCCVPDAQAMMEVLKRNGDGSPNFDCRLMTSPGPEPVTRRALREKWSELFHAFPGDILFYFSGHGLPTDVGGYLVTQDGVPSDEGVKMQDLVDLANKSSAASVLLILDCCFSGAAGNAPSVQGAVENQAILREGVTILAAAGPQQLAIETAGHGVFTKLLLAAFRGGAADVRGRVSAASTYAYCEAALGAWDQRPLYKSHAARLEPVRLCEPTVPDSLLRELPKFFVTGDAGYQLHSTYEETSKDANPEHVKIFKKFKRFQIGGLVRPKERDDLYWAALKDEPVILTDLGRFYLQLAQAGRI